MALRMLVGSLLGLAVAGCEIFLPQAGHIGQACYPDDTCAPGLSCYRGECVLQGGLGQPCFEDHTCDSQLTCVRDACVDAILWTVPPKARNLFFSEFSGFASFSRSGERMAVRDSSTYINPPDPMYTNAWVRILDTRDGSEITRMEGHDGDIKEALFHPRSEDVLVTRGSDDGTVRRWQVSTGQDTLITDGLSWPSGIAFSTDGGLLVACREDDCTIFDAQDWSQWRSFPCDASSDILALSADGERLYSEDRVLDTRTGQQLTQLQLDLQYVSSIALSPDGATLAVSGPDHLFLISTADWSEQARTDLPGMTSDTLSYSTDGLLLAGRTSDGSLRLWRASDATELAVLVRREHDPNFMAFSRDGAHLVSGGWLFEVMLWDVGRVLH